MDVFWIPRKIGQDLLFSYRQSIRDKEVKSVSQFDREMGVPGTLLGSFSLPVQVKAR